MCRTMIMVYRCSMSARDQVERLMARPLHEKKGIRKSGLERGSKLPRLDHADEC